MSNMLQIGRHLNLSTIWKFKFSQNRVPSRRARSKQATESVIQVYWRVRWMQVRRTARRRGRRLSGGRSHAATSASLHGCVSICCPIAPAPSTGPFIHGAINSNYRINNSTDTISRSDICLPILKTYATFCSRRYKHLCTFAISYNW